MKIVILLKEGKVSSVYAPNINTEIVVLDESEWKKNGLIYLERDALLAEHTVGLVGHQVGQNEHWDPHNDPN
jgi:hypothetical protein